jgi:hypothetical protein
MSNLRFGAPLYLYFEARPRLRAGGSFAGAAGRRNTAETDSGYCGFNPRKRDAMKLLLRYFRLAPGSMPQGHGNDNHARAKRIAEIRRLLAEIAVEPPEQRVCPEQDRAQPPALRPRLRARAGEAVEKSA